MALQDLSVKIGANTTGFSKGLKTVQSGVKELKSGISSLVKTGLALGGIALGISGIVDSMKAYAQTRNSVQRVNELFQESNKYIQSFASVTATAFGMAETTAYQYAATYGNLFKGITADTEENAKVTIAMMQASAVIASKTGRTMEDVNDRIRSGILGNTEAIEDLGVNVPISMIKTTKAFEKIAGSRSWDQLTYQEQQQIRVLSILEQANNQYGNSVSQISGMSLPRLGQAFKDLVSYAGMFVTAGLQPVINMLGKLVVSATNALKGLASVMGLKLEGTLASSQDALANSAEAATEELEGQKKALKALAGFDKLNVVKQSDSTSGGTSANGSAGNGAFDGLQLPELTEPDTTWADTLKDKLSALQKKLAPVTKSFSGLWDQLKRLGSFTGKALQGFYDNFLKPVGKWVLGVGLPRFVDAISNGLAAVDFDKINTALNNLWSSLAPFAINVGDGLLWFWENVLVPFGTWTANDLLPAFLDMLAAGFDALNAVWEAIKPGLEYIWDRFLSPIAEWTGGAIIEVIGAIKGAFSSLADLFRDKKEDIDKILKAIGDALSVWWNLWLKPLFTGVKDFIVETFGAVIIHVKTFVGGFIDIFSGIIDFITGIFSGDWEKAWEGIKQTLWGIFKVLASPLIAVINVIIGAINTVIKGLNAIHFTVPDWVPLVGGKEFGFDIKPLDKIDLSVPAFAAGGVVDRPTIGMIGEAGAEAVMPLEHNTGWIDKLAAKINASGGGGVINLTTNVYLEDGTLVGSSTQRINRASRSAGRAVLQGG